jgi:hypothetical protein
MPTTNTSTIKESGGDYSSVAAWESAKQGNMVTADTIEKAVISGVWTAAEGEINFTGWTCDATRYAWVQQVLTEPKLDTTKHYFSKTGDPAQVGTVHVHTTANLQKFVLEGVQAVLKDASAGSNGAFGTNTAIAGQDIILILDKCVGVLDGNGADAVYCGLFLAGSVQARNCVTYLINDPSTNWCKGFGWVDAAEYNPTVENVCYNCTSSGFRGNARLAAGFYAHVANDNVIFKNCIAQDCTGWGYDYNTAAAYSSESRNCLSHDANVPAQGSGHLASKTLTFEDEANEDFRLADSDIDAIDAGIDMDADADLVVVEDFFATARVAGEYDLGYHEFVGVALDGIAAPADMALLTRVS